MIGQPIFGTTFRLVNAGRPLHRVPFHVAMGGIVQMLTEECDGPWYCCLMFDDGQGTMRGLTETARRPAEDVLQKILDVAVRLNLEMHHNGHWILAWCDDQLHAFWRNAAGELQVALCFDEPWVRIHKWADTEFCERCEAAYLVAMETISMIDRTSNDAVRQDSSYRAIATH